MLLASILIGLVGAALAVAGAALRFVATRKVPIQDSVLGTLHEIPLQNPVYAPEGREVQYPEPLRVWVGLDDEAPEDGVLTLTIIKPRGEDRSPRVLGFQTVPFRPDLLRHAFLFSRPEDTEDCQFHAHLSLKGDEDMEVGDFITMEAFSIPEEGDLNVVLRRIDGFLDN